MPGCQLYLITPPGPLAPAAVASDLAAALDRTSIAALLVLPESAGPAADDLARLVAAVRPVAQDRGVAVLIDGDPELARRTGCDGVHTCPDGPRVADCRRIVGPGAAVGYSCRNSRHGAFVAGEDGADYILFGHRSMDEQARAETLGLLAWWAEAMALPSVALGPDDPATLKAFAQAGADFVIVGPSVWSHPDGPSAGLIAAASAVQEAVVPRHDEPGSS